MPLWVVNIISKYYYKTPVSFQLFDELAQIKALNAAIYSVANNIITLYMVLIKLIVIVKRD